MASPDLAHINLMHGTKWYGNHLGGCHQNTRRRDRTTPPPTAMCLRHPIAQASRRLYLALESIRLDELGEMAKIKR
jgi:hypothetical protein